MFIAADDCTKPRVAAVVFTYNRRDIVETTLRSARFADHLIVVDKGSTDGTAEVGKRYADEFHLAPWSPTVEETKAEYIPSVDAEWLLVLDDDECLNLEAIAYIQAAVRKGDCDVHYLPLRHYILGRHDERAYYWPEHHPVLFRRGALNFEAQVHGGKIRSSESYQFVDPGTGVAILHLSHPDVRTWIEKTNRYTDQRHRASGVSSSELSPQELLKLMNRWLAKVSDDEEPYLAAVAGLRAIYDVVDAVKLWEQQQPQRGTEAFAAVCQKLNQDYDLLGIGQRSEAAPRLEPRAAE